jgi:hypothetical protein
MFSNTIRYHIGLDSMAVQDPASFWKLCQDPHQSKKANPNPDPHDSGKPGTVEVQNGAKEAHPGAGDL